HRSPSVGDRKAKSGLALPRPIDRQRSHAAAHESAAPCVEFFFAGVESWQNDRDWRPGQIRRPAQIADHCRAVEWNRYPLHGRVSTCGTRLIASKHALVSREVLVRIVCKEVFCIVIID